jgi:putative ABC transport system permease protein
MIGKGMRMISLRRWILRRLLRKSVCEAALADFEERYDQISETRSKTAASQWFGLQIIVLFLFALKDSITWSVIMWENYIKSALRHIKKQKGYSLINLAGLTIGITCFVLISLYIQYEFSYDRFHKNAKDLYRVLVATDVTYMGKSQVAVTPGSLASAIQEEFPRSFEGHAGESRACIDETQGRSAL